MDQCKNFKPKCSLAAIEEVPHFFVDSLDGDALTCADYVDKKTKLSLGDPNKAIQKMCDVSVFSS